jgi:UDP-glucuronate 4-epimerase
MKILVTGAAGFIGSHLTQALQQRGDVVVGIDDFNDVVYPSAPKRANASRLSQLSNVRIVEADIRDRAAMADIFEAEKFDAVAHLAALAGVRNAVKYPQLYVEVDYNGSQNLMDAACQQKVSNFVFASTSSVYGDTRQIPFVETDPCDRPLQPYAAAKRAVEMLGYTYHYLFDLNFTAIRFFTVYGPNGRPDMFAYLLADSITKGVEIPLYEGGEMYRDWTYVGDIVAGIVAAIDRPLGYDVLNLGRGEPVRLGDFVEILEELAGGSANLLHRPMPAADVRRTYADISRAREKLGYDPQVSVPDGINSFWQWYREANGL